MKKRSRITQITPEAKVIRLMRESRGLSMRALARLLGISQTSVNHIENGRANISGEFIQNFLSGLHYKQADWDLFYKIESMGSDLKARCIKRIEKLDSKKLKLLDELLSCLK